MRIFLKYFLNRKTQKKQRKKTKNLKNFYLKIKKDE